jgi:hypothetical protein
MICDAGAIRVRRIAHPNPHERRLLDDRKRPYDGAARDLRLARHVHARPAGVERKTVIVADDSVGFHIAERKRIAAMRAAVGQRHGRAVRFPVERDGLA